MWRKGDTGTTQESQRGGGWRAEARRKARKPLEREERERWPEREQQRASLRLLTLVPVRCPVLGSGPQTWLCFLLGSHNQGPFP